MRCSVGRDHVASRSWRASSRRYEEISGPSTKGSRRRGRRRECSLASRMAHHRQSGSRTLRFGQASSSPRPPVPTAEATRLVPCVIFVIIFEAGKRETKFLRMSELMKTGAGEEGREGTRDWSLGFSELTTRRAKLALSRMQRSFAAYLLSRVLWKGVIVNQIDRFPSQRSLARFEEMAL